MPLIWVASASSSIVPTILMPDALPVATLPICPDLQQKLIYAGLYNSYPIIVNQSVLTSNSFNYAYIHVNNRALSVRMRKATKTALTPVDQWLLLKITMHTHPYTHFTLTGFSLSLVILPERAVTKYCDQYVCLWLCLSVCVCLSLHEDISGTTQAIFT